jgi:phospholipid/cholesterol/gamma-HCH transport system ATP-binding protein
MSILKNFGDRKAATSESLNQTFSRIDSNNSHNSATSHSSFSEGKTQQDRLPILELQNVTIELGRQTILKNISLKVFPGDTLVIIGPSGGGKTVLLKTLAGLFLPISGRSLCMGVAWADRDQNSKHELASKIGMQFQRSALFDELTAFENIDFVLKEHTTLDTEARKARIHECLKAVGLDKYQDYREHQLSGGMKQRVGIARSIAVEPAILFMDDPTAGLDPINADDVANLILELKNRISATLVVVTHDISRAFQFASESGRIVLVAEKGLLETGAASQTLNSKDPLVQQFIHGSLSGPLKLE